jgi:hypothetical protein
VLRTAIAVAALVVATSPAHGADETKHCLAASDQGQQQRDDGKYHRARESFATCARNVCPAMVRRDCLKWLADLDQATPTLVFGARNEAGGDLVDVTVLVDGALLLSKLDGKPVAVDPGTHLLHFQTAGYPAVEQQVVVRAGEKERLLSIQFGTPPPLVPSTPPAKTRAEGGDEEPRTSAWVFGGIAIVAFVSEAYFGISGLSDRSSLKSQPCAQDATCPASSVDSIRTKFTVADISLGVGLASAAISAYLFLAPASQTTPARGASVDVVPVPGGAAMSVGGRF